MFWGVVLGFLGFFWHFQMEKDTPSTPLQVPPRPVFFSPLPLDEEDEEIQDEQLDPGRMDNLPVSPAPMLAPPANDDDDDEPLDPNRGEDDSKHPLHEESTRDGENEGEEKSTQLDSNTPEGGMSLLEPQSAQIRKEDRKEANMEEEEEDYEEVRRRNIARNKAFLQEMGFFNEVHYARIIRLTNSGFFFKAKEKTYKTCV